MLVECSSDSASEQASFSCDPLERRQGETMVGGGGLHRDVKLWCPLSCGHCDLWKTAGSRADSAYGTKLGTVKAMLNGTMVVEAMLTIRQDDH